MNSMNKKQLMDTIIRKYGFECDKTIQFCKLCESSDDSHKIKKMYTQLMGDRP